MKQIRFIAIIAAAAALSVACAKEMDAPEGQSVSQITATWADDQTKTVLGEDGTSILWSPNDEISVFYNGDGLKFTSINSAPKATTMFVSSGTVVIGSTEDYGSTPYLYGIYPYSSDNAQDGEYLTLTVPVAQTAVEGSFGRGAYPSVGRSKDTNIAFYNVCGGVRFTLCQSGIRKIVLTGNSDEPLAGKVKVKFAEDGKPEVSVVISAQKSITLTAPDDGEFQTGKWYYISVLPTVLSEGFKMEFIKRTDESERGTRIISASREVRRSVFGSVENIDSGVSFKQVADVADLSAKGTANCYIVDAAGSYKFNGTVKGGSTESVGTPASAEVLWESFGTDVTPSVGDIVKSVSYSDGYVKFSTPSTLNNGNAVIAVKDASGNILWSWHIWVCKGFDPDASAQVYNNNAGTMMDRNLGATSATPGAVHALGLLYQWGRKDPFLGSSSISSNSIAASTITWPSAVSSNSSNGTIAYAVAQPTTFITYNSSNYDWYYTGSSSTDDTRWQTSGNDKGLYDPCPVGWRVPDGGESGVWSTAFGYSSYWKTVSNWDSTNKGMDFGTTDRTLGSGTIWYPAAGFRSNDDGTLRGVGSSGGYWPCTPYGNLAYRLCFGNHAGVSPSSSYDCAYGQSVRCLSESE